MIIRYVQFNYNLIFPHVTTHGYMQIFMCKIRKFPVEILIYMRR